MAGEGPGDVEGTPEGGSGQGGGDGGGAKLRVVGSPGRLRELQETIRTDGWRSSITAQAKTLQFILDHGKHYPPDQIDSLKGEVARRLAVTADRFSQLLRLDTLDDITQALRHQPTEPLRLGDEEVYPKGGWIGEYLLWSQGSEVPLAWHFWTAVALIGGACRRNLFVPMGNHTIYPNHYALFIGPTGMRKSTAIKTGRRVVDQMNTILDERDAPRDLRMKVIPDKITPERFLEMMKSELVSDGTKVRRTDSVAMICPDELTVLLGKSAFHSDVFIHLLTNLYDCPEVFNTSTITRKDESLHNVAITFLAGSTADWIRTSVTEDIFGGGFMGRCVFVFRERSGRRFPRPDPLDPIARNQLAEALLPLVTADRQEMVVQGMAWDYYDPWYNELKDRIESGDVEDNLRGFWLGR